MGQAVVTSGDKARIDLMQREPRSILYLPKILGHLKGRVVIIRGGGADRTSGQGIGGVFSFYLARCQMI